MPVQTYLEEYEELIAARSKILAGAQSVEIMGRKYTYPMLEALNQRIKEVRPLAMREESGRRGIRVRGVTPSW